MRSRFREPLVRYRIEYLRDRSDVFSVCHSTQHAELTEAERQAWLRASSVSGLYGANGFQIRDMDEGGEIVSVGSFSYA